jgi:hypothetical protein
VHEQPGDLHPGCGRVIVQPGARERALLPATDQLQR